MKREDKVSRLKERKRAREKRQRWRKREMKRREKLMAMRGINVGRGLPPSMAVDLGYPNAEPVVFDGVAMQKRCPYDKDGWCAKHGDCNDHCRRKGWMPNWWRRLPKILRTVTWPAVWLHVRYLKWRYPPSYIKTKEDSNDG